MRPGPSRLWLSLLMLSGAFGCALGEPPPALEIPATAGKADGVRGPWLLETLPAGDGFELTGRDGAGEILARVSLLAPSGDRPALLEVETGGASFQSEVQPDAARPLSAELPALDSRQSRLLLALGEDVERWYRAGEDSIGSESMGLSVPSQEPGASNECIPAWLRSAVPETCGSLLKAWAGLYAIGSLAMLHPASRLLGWGAKLVGTSGRLAAWLQALVPAKVAAASGSTALPYYLSSLKLAWESCHARPADAPVTWCPDAE